MPEKSENKNGKPALTASPKRTKYKCYEPAPPVCPERAKYKYDGHRPSILTHSLTSPERAQHKNTHVRTISR